jgi:hypothetical protein
MSKSGVDLEGITREQGFSAYTILPESPEVFIVNDTLLDPRFIDNDLVINPPYVRFYGGAALIVKGLRVGSLCIVDTVPREFSLEDKMTFLDIGQAISTLISDRRDNLINLREQRSMMLLSVLHNIRTPLFSAQMSCSLLNEKKTKILKIIQASNDPDAEDLINDFSQSFLELDSSLKKVHEFLDSSLCVQEIILNRQFSQSTSSNFRNIELDRYGVGDLIESINRLWI